MICARELYIDLDGGPLGTNLQIIIISLASQKDRRAFQIKQMERLGLSYTLWDATRPDDIPMQEMERRIEGWARPLRPTEVACLLSHRSVWKLAASHKSPTLILEDDAILSDATPLILPQLFDLRGIELINLETFRERKLMARKAVFSIQNFGKIFPLYRDRGGAACYIVWPSGASKLLEYTKDFSPLADAAINLVPGLVRQQIVPALAVQEMHLRNTRGLLEEGVVSAGSRPKANGLLQWLRGRKIRLYTSIHILMVSLRYLAIASRREIPFADDS